MQNEQGKQIVLTYKERATVTQAVQALQKIIPRWRGVFCSIFDSLCFSKASPFDPIMDDDKECEEIPRREDSPFPHPMVES